jgi:virulence factor Mce-like protein
MPRSKFVATVRRRLLGVVFLAVIAGLVGLSIAIYNKAFSTFVTVTLHTDHTGNQLRAASDVKERGIIVGAVKQVQSEGDGAIVTIDLDPAKAKIVPTNVKAQVLPKTLFGEQYLSLIMPTDQAARGPAIKDGAVIQQDRSKEALETQDVLGRLLPLLQAVKPAELNTTLTAVATALKGRGEKLGETLVNIDQYLKALNADSGVAGGGTYVDLLISDLKKLGEVANTYVDAAPDIFATLDNLQTSVKTLVEKKAQLENLLHTASDTSGVLKGFLANNEQNLIRLLGSTNKVYALLAEYSPAFACTFEGMADIATKLEKIMSPKGIALSVVVDNRNLGGYKPGEQPTLVTGYGPNCFGLPDNVQFNSQGVFVNPGKYRCLNDGAALTGDSCGRATSSLGTPAENALVDALIADSYGTSPDKVPDIATSLAAPLLRGSEVTVSERNELIDEHSEPGASSAFPADPGVTAAVRGERR